MAKKVLKVFSTLFFLLIILVFSLSIGFFIFFNQPGGNIPVEEFEVQVNNGDTAYSVASKLYLAGYIRSKQFFYYYVRFKKYGHKLTEGCFLIKPNSSTLSIVDQIFINKKPVTVKVTIPEGITLTKIRQILIENSIAPAEEINRFFDDPNYCSLIGLDDYKTAEGFLYPETYTFDKGTNLTTMIKSMVDLFYKNVEEIYPDYKKMSKKDFYNKVIMASIVEREVRNRAESARVAGVFYNRIDRNMRLESCATIQYILGKQKKRLFYSDTEIQHPYNTYQIWGLPPGPISNPGYEALKGAFYPEEHEYLYFLLKDTATWSHYFSKTLAEHMKAKSMYVDKINSAN